MNKKQLIEMVRRVIKEEIEDNSDQIPYEEFVHYPVEGQTYKGPEGEYTITNMYTTGKSHRQPYEITFKSGKKKLISRKYFPDYFKYKWLQK